MRSVVGDRKRGVGLLLLLAGMTKEMTPMEAEEWVMNLAKCMGVKEEPERLAALKVAAFTAMLLDDAYWAFEWLERPEVRLALLQIWLKRQKSGNISPQSQYNALNSVTKVRHYCAVRDEPVVINGAWFGDESLGSVYVSSLNDLFRYFTWNTIQPLLFKTDSEDRTKSTSSPSQGFMCVCTESENPSNGGVCTCPIAGCESNQFSQLESLRAQTKRADELCGIRVLKLAKNFKPVRDLEFNAATMLEWAVAMHTLKAFQPKPAMHVTPHECQNMAPYFYAYKAVGKASVPEVAQLILDGKLSTIRNLETGKDDVQVIVDFLKSTHRQKPESFFDRVVDVVFALSVLNSNPSLSAEREELVKILKSAWQNSNEHAELAATQHEAAQKQLEFVATDAPGFSSPLPKRPQRTETRHWPKRR